MARRARASRPASGERSYPATSSAPPDRQRLIPSEPPIRPKPMILTFLKFIGLSPPPGPAVPALGAGWQIPPESVTGGRRKAPFLGRDAPLSLIHRPRRPPPHRPGEKPDPSGPRHGWDQQSPAGDLNP